MNGSISLKAKRRKVGEVWMADIEKVIKGLEYCRLMCEGVSHNPCEGCPYQGSYACADKLKTDALALLKEQETEIRQLRLALDIAKGTCKGIKSGGG